MNLDFFKQTRILDGGMGQELLARGLQSKGTLWSASALIEEKNHKLLVDTHLSFIDAGADVIVTNNFSARRVRLEQNNVAEYFKFANQKAGELAAKAREISKKNVLIAAHGNSLRAIMIKVGMYKPEEISSIELPTGSPLCLDYQNGELIEFYYLD